MRIGHSARSSQRWANDATYLRFGACDERSAVRGCSSLDVSCCRVCLLGVVRRVGDLSVEGVDFFKLNEQGKVTELKVMLRPLNAAMTLAETMKAHFAGMTASQGP